MSIIVFAFIGFVAILVARGWLQSGSSNGPLRVFHTKRGFKSHQPRAPMAHLPHHHDTSPSHGFHTDVPHAMNVHDGQHVASHDGSIFQHEQSHASTQDAPVFQHEAPHQSSFSDSAPSFQHESAHQSSFSDTSSSFGSSFSDSSTSSFSSDSSTSSFSSDTSSSSTSSFGGGSDGSSF